jgi:adenosine deaminase
MGGFYKNNNDIENYIKEIFKKLNEFGAKRGQKYCEIPSMEGRTPCELFIQLCKFMRKNTNKINIHAKEFKDANFTE